MSYFICGIQALDCPVKPDNDKRPFKLRHRKGYTPRRVGTQTLKDELLPFKNIPRRPYPKHQGQK